MSGNIWNALHKAASWLADKLIDIAAYCTDRALKAWGFGDD